MRHLALFYETGMKKEHDNVKKFKLSHQQVKYFIYPIDFAD